MANMGGAALFERIPDFPETVPAAREARGAKLDAGKRSRAHLWRGCLGGSSGPGPRNEETESAGAHPHHLHVGHPDMGGGTGARQLPEPRQPALSHPRWAARSCELHVAGSAGVRCRRGGVWLVDNPRSPHCNDKTVDKNT